ncbi:hypothetical protein CEP54_004425 [Fusarium duplospermum]|uniref:Uncharacterized protein n=1 Tax=Fusarium duplospermum TaxID=1325734 RepID=A0A428QI13_9HYPO|nr:hypothetical protein CEP54_004425 [Fusarium duplospermum]
MTKPVGGRKEHENSSQSRAQQLGGGDSGVLCDPEDDCLIVNGNQTAPPTVCPPFRELPPRRKVVWVWICCCCGHGGMKVSVDPCPNCGIPRCPNCTTQRLNIRGASEDIHIV